MEDPNSELSPEVNGDLSRFPCSYAQQRLWFLDQFEQTSTNYNVGVGVRLIGKLDVEALERVFSEIVRRHESLRTTFAEFDGESVQMVSTEGEFELGFDDLSTIPVEERRPALDQLVRETAYLPFDLQLGPLFRCRLVRMSEEEHVALLTMHHIISDGWSLGVLVREVSLLYDAYAHGLASPLEELPVQYADYAVWQREWLQGKVLTQQLDYWRHQLADLPVLALPTDYARPKEPTWSGARRYFTMGTELSERLRQLARAEGATLFMVLLAGFAVLLRRYSGEQDLAVGTPVANRTRGEIEGLIGFFVNTLVLRVQVGGTESFGELLQRVKEVCLKAYAHQEVPFERVVEELKPERDLGRTPLFQVLFALQNAGEAAGGGRLQLTGLELEPMEVYNQTAKFELSVTLVEGAGGISGAAEYSTDLYQEETIERMLGHYVRLLEAAAAAPQQPVSSLPMLSDVEREEVLKVSGTRAAAVGSTTSVVELFVRQAQQTPAAIALEFADRKLSYGELEQQANQLARYLRGEGVDREVPVGLLAERSVETVVGLLAILKAGGVYVPLDVEYPRERLQWMVADAGIKIVLSSGSGSGGDWQNEAREINLSQQWPSIAAESSVPLVDQIAPDNAAYIIYTSGSTGTPKGVMMTHGALVNLLTWQFDASSIKSGERTLQFTSIGFDVSFQEVFSTLCAGGILTLVSAEIRKEPLALLHFIIDNHVARLFLPFVALQQIADISETYDVGNASLREVITAGEQLKITPQICSLFKRLNGCRLYNQYGPTETHVVTEFELKGAPAEWALLPPIGKPVPATQVYVLDEELQLVPTGVAGELYLGGVQLGRGYLGRAELTAERFVPDPYSGVSGGRLYQTGDVGRYVPGGEIEFLGRKDDQVKIRGYRIEPGEVEAVLRKQAHVEDAVVVARAGAGGDRQLVGYVVATEEVSGSRLRTELRKHLPEYMVPAEIVVLDEFPLTGSGKVNRRALPNPDVRERDHEEKAAPRGPVEELLAELYETILGKNNVGAHENFFELGGHSLLATRLISGLRRLFGVELPLRAVFEEPTVSGLARRVELALNGTVAEAAPPLLPIAGRRAMAPLSYAQQRLWFLDRLEPGSTAYVLQWPVKLRGKLDVDAFARALSEVVRRHESLRTTFAEGDGEPVQVIHEPQPVSVIVEDLKGLDNASSETRVRELALAEAAPFDLVNGPLLRCRLLQLAEAEQVVLLTMHHIVSDGWSMGVLVREVSLLYDAYARGLASPLEELPVQYAYYAVWQREWLQGKVLTQQLDYWRHQLADLPVLALPTDRPRSKTPRYSGGRLSFSLSREVTDKLRTVGRAEGATLFMVLLAGFAVLLRRYSGEQDLAVGTPVANRTRGEIEGLIGFFVNTLVLRVQVAGGESFGKLLQRVKEVCLKAYAHQEVPFERVVEELKPERDLGRTPLFQVLFALQNAGEAAGGGRLQLTGLELEPMEVYNQTAKFELSVTVVEGAGGISGAAEYSTDLYQEETIERMLGHYVRLLEAAAAAPQQAVSSLPMLSEAQRDQVLRVWNVSKISESEAAQSVVQLFEAQVRQRPEAVAVVCGATKFSYEELNSRTNQLAHYLRQQGVGPEVLVGVCLERSVEMVVGLLGILKAGGAYMPLDPAYPTQRLAYMLSDAQVQLVLTQQRLLEQLDPLLKTAEAVRWIALDHEWERIAAFSGDNPDVVSEAENLAYVIYTSGSTGQPKGVMITTGGLANYLQWAIAAYPFAADSGSPVHSTLSFDLTVTTLYGPLLVGGWTEVMSESDRSRGLEEAWEERAGYGVVKLTPAHLQLLNGTEESAARLHGWSAGLIVGGEALHWEQVRAWVAAGVRVYNEYGPTETVVGSCVYELQAGAEERYASGAVPIGRPIRQTEMYVLDQWQQPTPVGVSGEIYIGGTGLARGYWRRAELTAERFVPHPFSAVGGERLYRTGDEARYLEDGQIEYLGRRDHQVKLRGYRIELGEIESVLTSHGEIRDAVAIVKAGPSGDGRLVAYLVARETPVDIAELRDWLKSKLPDYMAPSSFVWLNQLPLTTNGKLDRRALDALDAPPSPSEKFVSPRTEIEKLVAGVWAEVLSVESVGLYDDFFELGGHSLLATRVMSRLRVAGIELPLRSIFDNSTVAGLAAKAETELKAAPATPITPAHERASIDKGLPLSFAQERLWFMHLLTPDDPAYNIVTAFRLSGRLDQAALERSMTEIARRHESLRTTFAQVDGRPIQIVSALKLVKIATLDLSESPAQQRELEVRRLSQEQVRLPFDLSVGPLWRVTLVRLQPEEHALFLTMHHVITDGWSLGIFARDLVGLYRSFSRNEPSSLPELPIQYADFAVWQRNWLSGQVLDQQLEYWRRQLAGAPPVLKLPLDHPRQAAPSSRGSRVSIQIELETTRSLQQLSHRAGVTLFMTLLAAFKTLLQRYTGQEDIVVGTDIANRNRTELENLIGFFVNMLVLRTDLSGDPTFVELLARVREVALGAYAHQDLPFARLVDELQIPRDTSHNPLFQVVFVLQNAPTGQAIVPGLNLEPLPIDTEGVPFDMVLSMWEVKEGLSGSLLYRTDLFERATVERMVKHLRHLLEAIVQEPEQRLSGFSLLAKEEVQEYVPETFSGLTLSQKELEGVILELQRTSAE